MKKLLSIAVACIGLMSLSACSDDTSSTQKPADPAAKTLDPAPQPGAGPAEKLGQ